MKRLMILLLIIIPCIAFGADQTCTSGNKTGVASGLIYAGNGVLRAIQITPDSGDVVLIVYDNATAASGKVVGYWAAKGSANPESTGRPFNDAVFENGLYYEVDDTGSTFSVDYAQGEGACD